MRYYQKIFNIQLHGAKNTSTRMRMTANFTVPMRDAPAYTRTASNFSFQEAGSSTTSSNTTEAQSGSVATADGVTYARSWDFGGFTSLDDRTYIGSNAGHVFNLDSEL